MTIQIPTNLLSDIGIYILVSPNGKVYVGQSRSLRKRLYEHSRLLRKGTHSNMYLQNSYNKHKSFDATVVEYVDDIDKLTERETYWIEKFDSYNSGFNLTKAADASGTQRSDETKQLFSQITTERWKDPEFREACFRGREKYLQDPLVRQKMSETTKEYFIKNPEAAKKHSEFMKEKAASDGYREKFLTRMQTWRDGLTKEQLSEIAKKSCANRTPESYEIVRLKSIITRSINQKPDYGVAWVSNKSRNGLLVTSAQARWTELCGKEGTKGFSVNKYGVLPAWKMAVSYRLAITERLVEECKAELLRLNAT